MMICGRNTTTLPTPEITPFCRKLCSSPAGRVSCTNCPSAPKLDDSNSISGCAQANTAWNITNRISARIRSPPTGCSTTASIRAVQVSGRVGRLTLSAMMRSASRWVARNCAAVSGCQRFSRRRRFALGGDLVGQPQQLGGAALAHRNRGDHGDAERSGELCHIHRDAAARRDVEHVEHQRQRPAGRLQFEHEADGQPQIGGVGHAQHEIRRASRRRCGRAPCRG